MSTVFRKGMNYKSTSSLRHGRPVKLCGSASKSDVGAIMNTADLNNSELADSALVKVGGAPPQHTDFLKILTGMNSLCD